MMRHMRDPITGLCTVCGKSGLHDHSAVPDYNYDNGRKGGAGYDSSRSPSPVGSPRSRSPDGRDVGSHTTTTRTTVRKVYVQSPTDDRPGSASSYYSDRGPSPVTTKVTTYRGSPSPTNVYRTAMTSTSMSRGASPTQSVSSTRRVIHRRVVRRRNDDGCCGRRCCYRGGRSARRVKRFNGENEFYDDDYYGEDRCCGYSTNETASYGAGTWGPRRCCALGIAIGVIAALAGLAVALYFGITAALTAAKQQQAVSNYILNNKVQYVVYGLNQPCNQYNNGTATSVIPNCAATTTSIGLPANGFVAPTDPSWAVPSRASCITVGTTIVSCVLPVVINTGLIFLAETVSRLSLSANIG